MTRGVCALFLALFLSLAYVDARNQFWAENAGQLRKDTVYSSHHGQELVSSSILYPDELWPGYVCDACLEISREVEKFLTDPELQKDLSEFYHDACHILPSDLRVKCVEMLDTYANQAMSFLQTFFAEQNLCNSTGLCPVDSNTLPISSFHRVRKVSDMEQSYDLIEDKNHPGLRTELQMHSAVLQKFITKISDNTSCVLCCAAMDELNDDLENPETKIRVIRVLLKACEHVEDHVKQCKRMLLDYGPMILSDLEKYLKSSDPCLMLHICDAPKRQNLLKLPTKQSMQALISSK